jgi:hypothetical protein
MKDFKGLFIKIGKLEHLKILQKEGLLHCATLQYFANLKDAQGKGDSLENVVNLTFYEDAMMYLIPEDLNTGKIVPLNISGSHKYGKIKSHCGNLYCLYSFNFNNLPLNQIQKFIVDGQLGTHALIINNSDIFFKRLERTLKNEKLQYQSGFIEYIDFSKYSGDKNFFQKDIKFEKQKEFRILIHYSEEQDLQLKIGKLDDISDLISVEELLQKIVIHTNTNFIEDSKS